MDNVEKLVAYSWSAPVARWLTAKTSWWPSGKFERVRLVANPQFNLRPSPWDSSHDKLGSSQRRRQPRKNNGKTEITLLFRQRRWWDKSCICLNKSPNVWASVDCLKFSNWCQKSSTTKSVGLRWLGDVMRRDRETTNLTTPTWKQVASRERMATLRFGNPTLKQEDTGLNSGKPRLNCQQ